MEQMGSKGNDSKRSKPMRRRSQTRRVLQDSVINMAEARREIVHALQLHRSSTRTAAATTTTSATVAATSSSAQCCYYSLTEAMPIPEPLWSTTAPTIPAAPSATAATAVESLEFEWGESQAAAYNWWIGFLKTLDSKINNVENYSKYPHSRVFGYQNSLKLGEGKFVGASDDQQNTAPDQWLTFPTSDDQQGDHTTTTNPHRDSRQVLPKKPKTAVIARPVGGNIFSPISAPAAFALVLILSRASHDLV